MYTPRCARLGKTAPVSLGSAARRINSATAEPVWVVGRVEE